MVHTTQVNVELEVSPTAFMKAVSYSQPGGLLRGGGKEVSLPGPGRWSPAVQQYGHLSVLPPCNSGEEFRTLFQGKWNVSSAILHSVWFFPCSSSTRGSPW